MSRPRRSPIFQTRKPSGMKTAESMFDTEVIDVVKTGKTMVTAKQMNTAEARKGSFLNRVVKGTEGRSVLADMLWSLRDVVALSVRTSPSDVPFSVVSAVNFKVPFAFERLCRRTK